MKVIFIKRKHSNATSFYLGAMSRRLIGASIMFIPLLFGVAGYNIAVMSNAGFDGELAEWRKKIASQDNELADIKQVASRQIDALTVRMAELQARLTRLDALGERVADVANLDKTEFDFGQRPAVGGLLDDNEGLAASFILPDLNTTVKSLEDKIDNREQQLDVLDSLLNERKFFKEIKVDGWPVETGWISSFYGKRTDPFHGRASWHQGIDFASKKGTNVLTVASGVVTWVGVKQGYGLAIEVNHGGGYLTRYAHNQSNTAKVGDIVNKGQAIAKVGSSGRSTGSHVHFEVYKHGRAVDPASYVRRTDRS
jgi:murein DD-endopeptidase MepM/ murein hydrolase activator NlpD